MFSINLIIGKVLMMQFCHFFSAKIATFGAVSVHQRAAMQQLSAKVFKLSFEYVHIYGPKVVIFAEK